MQGDELAAGGPACHIVVALMGLPGAGKSTIARYLLTELPLHAIDRDRIRAALFPQCTFTREEKEAANAAVLAAVAANCRLGRTSLVDGLTFARARELEALRECVVEAGYRLLPLFIDCLVAVARARIAAQAQSTGHVAGDRKPSLAAEVAGRFDAPPADACRIESDQPEQDMCGEALTAVRAALAGALRS
jgi:predicted kinase